MVREISINDYFVRPSYYDYAVYRRLGDNKAKEIYKGAEEDCDNHLARIQKRILDILDIQFKNKDYIYNLMMENMQRVTELKADLDNEGLLDYSTLADFTTENEMFREWCDEYEFEYRMIEDPEDENYLETSEKFFKAKLLETYGKR